MQDQEKGKSGDAAKARVLEQLLPVIDNFEIAGKSIKTETEAEQKINESYQSLYRQTVDIFRGLGLEAVPTVGVQLLYCACPVVGWYATLPCLRGSWLWALHSDAAAVQAHHSTPRCMTV
ncbi:MAG: nucleotide exchange factor GrpE [Akkermansiaceae bacterium]|nr:nucleotide exchange factor GrpE [Akkermansiaceae bacterium]